MSIGKIRFDQRSLHFDSGGISLHILMKTKLFMRFVPVIHLLLFSYSHTVELKWKYMSIVSLFILQPLCCIARKELRVSSGEGIEMILGFSDISQHGI